MPAIIILPFAEAQMEDALAYTTGFGEAKYLEYAGRASDLVVGRLAAGP